METKLINKSLENFVIEESDDNYFVGYASVFDVVDTQGEVVVRGAYTKTIQEGIPKGKIKILAGKHMSKGGDICDTVATVVEAVEDERGLKIKAEWKQTEFAQKIRQSIYEDISKGRFVGLSIGGVAINWIIKGETTYLTEIKLNEVTLTYFPACEEAVVFIAKTSAVDTVDTAVNTELELAKSKSIAFAELTQLECMIVNK